MVRSQVSETRRKESESEKITINLGFVDLGHIDLLVAEGFYSNRTDFIRTAIRNQVHTHGEVLKNSVARRSMVLGLQRFTRQDLEKLLAAGEQLHIHVLGLATIDDDVPAQAVEVDGAASVQCRQREPGRGRRLAVVQLGSDRGRVRPQAVGEDAHERDQDGHGDRLQGQSRSPGHGFECSRAQDRSAVSAPRPTPGRTSGCRDAMAPAPSRLPDTSDTSAATGTRSRRTRIPRTGTRPLPSPPRSIQGRRRGPPCSASTPLGCSSLGE